MGLISFCVACVLFSVLACIEDLQGTYLHLCADLPGARKCYETSLSITPLPRGFEPALKLASIFVEVGTTEEVHCVLSDDPFCQC